MQKNNLKTSTKKIVEQNNKEKNKAKTSPLKKDEKNVSTPIKSQVSTTVNPSIIANENKLKEMPSKEKADAIFCIVKRGFTDLVMVAARKAGAFGGTVIHGRGTGSKEFEKFYGIAVSPEKEIVIIVVKSTLTDKILLAINESAGLDSPGQGVAFAMPVSDYLGMTIK